MYILKHNYMIYGIFKTLKEAKKYKKEYDKEREIICKERNWKFTEYKRGSIYYLNKNYSTYGLFDLDKHGKQIELIECEE